MPLSTQSQSQDQQYVLVANLDNARNLSNILKAITCRDHAIFTATANGLKVTVEDCKCMQANAFIQVFFFFIKHLEKQVFLCLYLKYSLFLFKFFQADIFQEFTLKEDMVIFQINLTVLLDCLNIFGGSTAAGEN